MAKPSGLNSGKDRIDALIVERGLLDTRQQARAALLAGVVLVNGAPVTKPGALVRQESVIEVLQRPQFVSRGGEKLAHALAFFQFDARGVTCVDIGASTGGFTDCLLQNGAARVYAVDVGYGVLDYTLRKNPQVVVKERTNARDLPPLPEQCDLATIDVAFIGI